MARLIQGNVEGEAGILMKYLDNRFKRNKNWLCAITGGTGSGKSYASIKICELWYQYYFNKPFPVEHICFSIEDMIKLFLEEKLKRGDIVILEESGTLINSKDFQMKINKLFNFFMQSFRSLNVGLIFNLPSFSMMDKSTRILVHSHFITKRIIEAEQVCELKPYYVQINQASGKEYRKYLRVTFKERGMNFTRKVDILKLTMPSDEVIEDYEKRKRTFVLLMADNLLERIEKEREFKRPLTQFQIQLFDYVKEHPGHTYKELSEALGKEVKTIWRNVQWVQRKGHNIKNFVGKLAEGGKKTTEAPILLN